MFWCPKDFPENFIAEWEANNIESNAGLFIVFFAAKGLKDESIFDPSLSKRTVGTFSEYTKGAMNCHHILYYFNEKDQLSRDTWHLRKNKGFYLLQRGGNGMTLSSAEVLTVKLIVKGAKNVMYIHD